MMRSVPHADFGELQNAIAVDVPPPTAATGVQLFDHCAHPVSARHQEMRANGDCLMTLRITGNRPGMAPQIQQPGMKNKATRPRRYVRADTEETAK